MLSAMTRAELDKRPADVSAMFDAVADRYDLLNDVLSLGQLSHRRQVGLHTEGRIQAALPRGER
jgi:ubiquinone/menaquinone biosynthesis C-methylase UbiE